ncbi:hypothetical protein RRG08_035179 [Elysia crispata]|uniref:Sulfotransferase domain-containing protein n=1 Tax=Elysia crispata TaxID=231223 RepID=A0AAE0YHM1_9GAST|nr:hypothetical protein RRG08_035179 [Elysia crispata]
MNNWMCSHWFYEILNMLLTGKAEYLPRGKAADMIDANSPDQVEGIRSPRVLNTHVRFRYLPREAIEKKTKIVVLLRNPKDVCVSLYNHMKDWLHGGYTGSWQDFFDIYMDTGFWYGNWFDTVLDWEQEMAENQHLPIRLASFEEMFKNPVEQILELSKFLELDRSPDLCSQIAEKCSFHQLKAASSNMKDQEFPPGTWRENAPGFFRKGKVGDWKNWFTVAQNERFDSIYKSCMKESKHVRDKWTIAVQLGPVCINTIIKWIC